MNFRDVFPSSKVNPKIKLAKQPIKLISRRHHTDANEVTVRMLPTTEFDQSSSIRLQSKRQIPKMKYLEVYSRFQPKEPINKKTSKVHTNKPFVLNKYLKTETSEITPITQQNHQIHKRKISEIGTTYYPKLIEPSSKYEIKGVAGKGTFGTVFYGYIKATGKKVAIKKVLQDKRYKNRELQILKALKHPNLLEMKDYFMTQEDDQQYLNVVMDCYPQNLYECIKKKGMNGSLIKIYMYQMLRGLMYLNFYDIAHRDIKPHNILVNQQTNKVVICDFGSAKQLIQGGPNLAYICSRCYRAPELIFGATDYTSQIDLWSAGCILVEMINGKPPFLADSQVDQLIEIIKILGTPSKEQIFQMNPSYDEIQYNKFPTIKKTSWKNFLQTKDLLLVDLVHNLMQYSPKKRYTAEEALKHKYFDQLRFQQGYKELHETVKVIPELFGFIPEELKLIKNVQLLIPKWQQTNHTSHLSSSNLKSLNCVYKQKLRDQILKANKLSTELNSKLKAIKNFNKKIQSISNEIFKKNI